MSEEADAPSIPPDPEPAPAAEPPPRSRFRKWLFLSLGTRIVVPIVVFAVWSWIALSYSYSDGYRAGYVQKFSKKGWICKTWEGELAMVNLPGAAQERWVFSVRDDSIVALINGSMGQRVSLHYEEKRGIPTTCFGETDYFIVGVQPLGP